MVGLAGFEPTTSSTRTTYLGADMPNWMRITGGTGMHAGFLPGYPDSHGCIRMLPVMAEHFFESVVVGTPVRIEH